MTRQAVENSESWKKRLSQVFALHCDGATELASREQDERLGFPETLALRGHLLACGPCRRFRRQLQFLREASRRLASGHVDSGPEELSAEARERIAKGLRDRRHENESSGESS